VTPDPAPLFQTDDDLAARIRAVASELRVLASRRRAIELAGELETIARALCPEPAA
jgi:hypothetical protein